VPKNGFQRLSLLQSIRSLAITTASLLQYWSAGNKCNHLNLGTEPSKGIIIGAASSAI